MTYDDHQVVYHFPNYVACTLKELLAFFAGQGNVDLHVECHKVLH